MLSISWVNMFPWFIFKKGFRKKQLKVFISVGAGNNQLPLINAARELGYHVIGIDQDTSSPGLLASNIKIQESIHDYEEIYQKIRELFIDGKIHAVLTRSYGEAVKTTSFLCEQLGINYFPFGRVEDFLNKKRMKNILKQNGIRTPSFKTYTAKTKTIKNFPCIVKPFSGHAKSNVKLINNAAELTAYIKSNQDEDSFLIEEYIAGSEIIAIGLTVNGKFRLYSLSDKETTPPPYFADVRHVSPSAYSDRWDEIEAIGQKLSEAFELHTTPLLYEIRINGKGEMFVIEAAPEFGGEYISDIMIPETTGSNIFKNAIKTMDDKNTELSPVKRNHKNVIIRYITGENGFLNSFDQINIKNFRDNLIYLNMFKKPGSKTAIPTTNHDRIGVIITKGKTREAAETASDEILKNLNINITKNRKSDIV
ncbi:MAG: ATP-grasp domain-containing protein [Spirochaetes bacterium]|nr:ATP-grasp domain-containing protein [Spirochaetota bacterium]